VNWRAEVPVIQRPHLFAPDPGPLGPEYGTRCPFPDCPATGFSRSDSPGIWCVLHHPRHGQALPPEVARLIGPTNQAAQSDAKEVRGR
jgi:hypothetical protein